MSGGYGESQRPALLSQVKGFIPVDIYLKTDDPVLRAAACARFALSQARIDAGELADGTFDEGGAPTGLLYSDEALFFTALAGGAPWQPLKELLDSDAATCDGPEAPGVPWDDHLGDIEVPVFYVGAGGGFGDFGLHTTTLLGSTDVTSHVVSLTPPEARLSDFGHADLFVARDARTLAWQAIFDWIAAH